MDPAFTVADTDRSIDRGAGSSKKSGDQGRQSEYRKPLDEF